MVRLVLALGLVSAPAAPAQNAPVYRSDVQLVNLSVTVRDAAGQLVENLSRDDFEVLEDGVPQKISFFARSSDVPLSLALLVDTSGSQRMFLSEQRAHLRMFLSEVIRQRDAAMLLAFDEHLHLLCDFTPDQVRLAESLDRFRKGDRRFPMLGPPEERRIHGTGFYDAIYHATIERLRGTANPRRAVILFSDGEDNSSAWTMMDAIEAAQEAGVVVYAIHYRGGSKDERPHARHHYGLRVMRRIALETGGSSFEGVRAGLSSAFESIGLELRSSWEIGYHSTTPQRDGRFRNIVVRVKQPGMKVRAKSGYYAR